jgi:hypothetical protein
MRLGRKNANDLDATLKNAALCNENVMKRVAARKKVYVPVVKYFMVDVSLLKIFFLP